MLEAPTCLRAVTTLPPLWWHVGGGRARCHRAACPARSTSTVWAGLCTRRVRLSSGQIARLPQRVPNAAGIALVACCYACRRWPQGPVPPALFRFRGDFPWTPSATIPSRWSPSGWRPGRSWRSTGRRGRHQPAPLLRAGHVPLPLGRPAHGPPGGVLGRRRDRQAEADAGLQRAAPHRLGRLRPAGRERGHQARGPPQALDLPEHRRPAGHLPPAGDLLRLVAR